MAAKVKLAILLITPERLIRADFAAGNTQLYEQEAPPTEDLGLLVDTCLRLSPIVPKQVLLLTTEVWIQNLSLPIATSRTSTEAEINQLLRFEVEAETGLSALDMELSSSLLGQNTLQSQFQVIALSRLQFLSVADVVQDFGSQFLGLSHPSGLPVSLSSETPEAQNSVDSLNSWARIELWNQVTVFVGAQKTTRILDGLYDLSALPEDFQDVTVTEHIQLFQTSSASPLPGASNCLEDNEKLKAFMQAWHSQAQVKDLPIARLKPPAKPISGSLKVIISFVLMVVALVGAQTTYQGLKSRSANLEKAIEAAKLPQQSLSTLQAKSRQDKTKLDNEQKQFETDLVKQETAIQIRDTLQARYIVLLAAIRRHCGEDMVVSELETKAQSITVKGQALNTEAAQRFARQLAKELEAVQMIAGPAREKIAVSTSESTLWEFEIEIRDAPKKLKPSRGGEQS